MQQKVNDGFNNKMKYIVKWTTIQILSASDKKSTFIYIANRGAVIENGDFDIFKEEKLNVC